MLKINLSDRDKWLLICALIFLLILPLSLKIDFYQNDDWVYYKNVEYFLNGDFRLDPYLGPTFYVQGLMGMLFSKLFGLGRLPILTLIVSVVNLFILGVILLKFFKKKLFDTLLLSFLYFFNPVQVYSMWGFMTDNYFMLCFFTAMYFFLEYETFKKHK